MIGKKLLHYEIIEKIGAGGDLSSRIGAGGFSLDETLAIARQIATGLDRWDLVSVFLSEPESKPV